MKNKYEIIDKIEWEETSKQIKKISAHGRYVDLDINKIKSTKIIINSKYEKNQQQQNLDFSYSINDNFNPIFDEDNQYIQNGISRKVLKKIRNIYPNIVLDLHGLNVYSAEQSLFNFINKAYKENFKCVYIIHGKGLSSKDNIPILKPKVLLWLRSINIVLAYTNAKDQYGGQGATVVLIKNYK